MTVIYENNFNLSHLPVVSLMSKKEVNGFPSDTRPYRISRGTPLSPSSA